MESSVNISDVKELINQMCQQANVLLSDTQISISQLQNRLMGFRISTSNGVNNDTRMMGKSIAEIMWKDEDGSRTLAMLYNDVHGHLFELDIWKSNFGMPSNLNGWKNN